LLAVDRAIHLDDQPPFDAAEIGDVDADGMLATKAATLHLSPPQTLPQLLLGRRRSVAQLPCPLPQFA
jgi:hypothetical protein